VLAKDPSLIYAAGEQQPVDLLAGSNADEANFFGGEPQSLEALRTYVAGRFGDLADEFHALYPAASDAEASAAYRRAFNDELAWQMRKIVLYQGIRGLGAYAYFFTRVPPGQEERGATHVAELPYMFNQVTQHPEWQDTDRSLSDAMARYWVRFAASTNPNTQGLPTWPAYRSEEQGNVMLLGDSVATETTQQPSAAALAFFDKLHAALLAELQAAQ
jgi:para-nitrobenzyl esterase